MSFSSEMREQDKQAARWEELWMIPGLISAFWFVIVFSYVMKIAAARWVGNGN